MQLCDIEAGLLVVHVRKIANGHEFIMFPECLSVCVCVCLCICVSVCLYINTWAAMPHIISPYRSYLGKD